MESLAALLLIVGCSPDLEECREVPVPVAFHDNFHSCTDEAGRMLGDQTSEHRYFGTCVEFDPRLMDQDAEIVWDVSEDQGLQAALLPLKDDSQVAEAASSDDYMRSN